MGDPTTPATLVREFWRRMASNDFDSVRPLLAGDFLLHWPQSGERIRGGENFARMNAEYPGRGRWSFRLNRLVADGDTVVTQVSVSDGEQHAEPVSFFTVHDGRIVALVEYWPEPFAPRPERRHLVEPDA
jgi:ketosteroid isomerase-like protein